MEPSKEITEEFQSNVFVLDSGKVVTGIRVVGAATLGEVVRYLRDGTSPDGLVPAETDGPAITAAFFDLADVIGQEQARRALEVAAAGGHHATGNSKPGLTWT